MGELFYNSGMSPSFQKNFHTPADSLLPYDLESQLPETLESSEREATVHRLFDQISTKLHQTMNSTEVSLQDKIDLLNEGKKALHTLSQKVEEKAHLFIEPKKIHTQLKNKLHALEYNVEMVEALFQKSTKRFMQAEEEVKILKQAQLDSKTLAEEFQRIEKELEQFLSYIRKLKEEKPALAPVMDWSEKKLIDFQIMIETKDNT